MTIGLSFYWNRKEKKAIMVIIVIMIIMVKIFSLIVLFYGVFFIPAFQHTVHLLFSSLKSLWSNLPFHPLLGLPLPLLLSSSILAIRFPTYFSSLLITCSCYFNFLSCIFLDISNTLGIPWIPLLILSSLVLHIRLIMRISASFSSTFLLVCHVSAPFIIADLIRPV